MKSTFKYVAAHLHHFETNKHGFWSEGVWVMDITEATLYNSPLKAQTHGGKHTHPIKVEIAMSESNTVHPGSFPLGNSQR